MTPGPIFLVLGLALLGGAWVAGHWPARILLLYAALPCLALSGAYFLRTPGVFLKRTDGRLSALSWLAFGAYHVANLLVLTGHRRLGRKEPWNEIVPGLYVGERPGRRDEALWKSRQAGRALHVLDLTAETAEPAWIRKSARYLCLRLLDRTAPDKSDLERGVAFIQEGLAGGVVLVHCAFGHSRSALYVAAYLIVSGRCRTVEEAWTMVQAKRPGAYLNRAQRSFLEQALR